MFRILSTTMRSCASPPPHSKKTPPRTRFTLFQVSCSSALPTDGKFIPSPLRRAYCADEYFRPFLLGVGAPSRSILAPNGGRRSKPCCSRDPIVEVSLIFSCYRYYGYRSHVYFRSSAIPSNPPTFLSPFRQKSFYLPRVSARRAPSATGAVVHSTVFLTVFC